jgi:hypothetical protein
MSEAHFWTREHFPVLYQDDEIKGVLVDPDSFAQIELILDNLLNREEEPEDAILAAATVSKQMLYQAKQATPTVDWERELDEL